MRRYTDLFKRKYAHKVVIKSTVPVLTVKADDDIQSGKPQSILSHNQQLHLGLN